MTGEEQKHVRELEKSLVKVCREIGKRRGWKTIAGRQYQVRDGMLYVLSVSFLFFDSGKTLKVHLRCKPVVLDEIYWVVFHMAEEAAKQSFSVLACLPLCGSLNTERLDVSHLTPEEAAACLEALP